MKDLVRAIHWLRQSRQSQTMKMFDFGAAWKWFGRAWNSIDWANPHHVRRYAMVERILEDDSQ